MAQIETVQTEHPGFFIAEELRERGWTRDDLALSLGRDKNQLNRLLAGKTGITPESALALAEAFDVPADFFLTLQRLYDSGARTHV